MKYLLPLVLLFISGFSTTGYEDVKKYSHLEPLSDKDIQPFVSHAVRLKDALKYIGSPLSTEDEQKVELLRKSAFTNETIGEIQKIFDPYCIARVSLNDSTITVDRGRAAPVLMQGGWKIFLVKVENKTGFKKMLQVSSPSALSPQHQWDWGIHANDMIDASEAANRFLDVQIYTGSTMSPTLSGMETEYIILQLYSKVAGERSVKLDFGTGLDEGNRFGSAAIDFMVNPAVKVVLNITDSDGRPAMAAITITDSIDRNKGKLGSVYPLPSRRVAAFDEYPDFFFQEHVYRATGEHVMLPPGNFTVKYTRGPEYLPQYTLLEIPAGVTTLVVDLPLKRWIDVSKSGWHSGDHHVHASGCSHYYKPEEGVNAIDMWRQAAGEDLKISSVLSWGPGWYHQKNNFTGKQHHLSTKENIMQYDVEVSGFPSSHAGHLVLLRLKEDDYPGTKKIEDWPSWTGPVLQWAQSQGAITGYAHSGDGLKPAYTENFRLNPAVTDEEKVHAPAWRTYEEITTAIPNYIVPEMSGVGANEYIVTATRGWVNFFSAGNTGLHRELNMWYHTLNAGIRMPISGETDFPCLSDERVGYARSYFKTKKNVSYNAYIDAIKAGRSYVSDGFSHIMNFSVNGVEPGEADGLLHLGSKAIVTVKADVAAYLSLQQDAKGEAIATSHLDVFPCWNIERARVRKTRNVNVDLIINGSKVDSKEIEADGTVQAIQFTPEITEGSWVALRIYASAHTNPVYVNLNNKSVSISKSIEWCIQSVDKCWQMKQPQIREEEKAAAKNAYDEAREWYRNKLNNENK